MTKQKPGTNASITFIANTEKTKKPIKLAWALIVLILLASAAALANRLLEGNPAETHPPTTQNPTPVATVTPSVMETIPPVDFVPMVRPLIIYGEQEALIFSGLTAEPIRLAGPLSRTQYSLDGSKALFRVQERADQEADLWFFDGKSVSQIASDVYTAELSDDGTAVCFLQNIKESPDEFYGQFGDLYRYDCITGMTELIDQNVGYYCDSELEDHTRLILSPDGRSIGYEKPVRIDEIKNLDSERFSVNSFICVEGSRPEELGPGIKLIVIANHGQLIYYFKANNTGSMETILRSDGTDRVIQTDLVSFSAPAIYFNSDYSEMLLSVSGETNFVTYFNAAENLSLKLADEYGHVIWPKAGNKNESSESSDIPDRLLADHLTGVVLNFANTDLLRLTEDHQLERLAQKPDAFLTSDLDSSSQAYAYYLNADRLRFCPAPQDPDRQPIEFSTGFDLNSSGRFLLVYHANLIYTDADGMLWQVNANGERQKLVDGIDSESIRLNQNGDNLYFLKNDGAADSVGSDFYIMPISNPPAMALLAENVAAFAVSPQGVAYARISDSSNLDSYDVFYSQNGSDFRKLFSNQQICGYFANYCLQP